MSKIIISHGIFGGFVAATSRLNVEIQIGINIVLHFNPIFSFVRVPNTQAVSKGQTSPACDSIFRFFSFYIITQIKENSRNPGEDPTVSIEPVMFKNIQRVYVRTVFDE